jgi:hypothetical protein
MTTVVPTPAKNPLDAMAMPLNTGKKKRMTARLCSRPGKTGKVSNEHNRYKHRTARAPLIGNALVRSVLSFFKDGGANASLLFRYARCRWSRSR